MTGRWTRHGISRRSFTPENFRGPSLIFTYLFLLWSAARVFAQTSSTPLPEIPQLIQQVEQHQKQLEKVRENYTYTSTQVTQDIDSKGQVKKTETEEFEVFFANSHEIRRLVKRDGKPLDERDEKKETARVTKQVEKAEKTPPGRALDGPDVSITQFLAVMDVSRPRREMYHARPCIVFDFIGRKDAKTHGLAEDASKRMQGTLWVDEADREVAHMDVSFDENFKVGGGLLATVQKGSNFHFEQSPINGELWLPVGADASVQARVLVLKGIRQNFSERNTDFKRFHVEAQSKASEAGKP